MNWEAIGALAEAIGVIAIFLSLIYMSVQIKHNTKEVSRNIEASRLAAFERNIESGNRTRELLITHPEIAELFMQGAGDLRKLEGVDALRFGLLVRNILSSIQGAYIRQLSLSHDPMAFAGTAAMVDSVLANPGVRDWLRGNEMDWRPEFADFVQHRLALIESSDKPA